VPGSFWNYTNPGFSLAGLVVQNESGETYADYMRDHIWAPAGMEATFLDPAEVVAYGNYSHGHRWVDPVSGNEVVFAPDDYDNAVIAPAGYAFSRPSDMVRWANLLMAGGGDVLAEESVSVMQAEQVSTGYVPTEHYGFGIFVSEAYDRLIYDHGGNIPGWSSQLYWSPDDGVAVSILANTIQSLTSAAGCAMLTMMGEEPDTPPDYSTDPETWGRYVGDYAGLAVDGSTIRLAVTQPTSTTLLATFPDVEIAPGVAYTSTLTQYVLDTFVLDTNADGQPDSDVTFLAHPDEPEETYWVRNRSFVLTRQVSSHAIYLPRTYAE
jgi:CubicO group peptidase (beta-lactamase class C family)